ncbi:MAG: RiPP maturation radical SAM protein 1 [Deltaproteobacteria bacterium]|nr:RiPP maturation radical SAM protein 1 [Deltaproteobacteria bacterium]
MATPSLALGLLQASLLPLAVRTRQANLQLDLAAALGWRRYELVARRWEAGEWVFAGALFPGHDLDPAGFLERILRAPSLENWTLSAAEGPEEAAELVEETASAAIEARRLVPEFLAESLLTIARRSPSVVAFSCTFQQRVASLALARELASRLPGVFVVFGGIECHQTQGLELFRQFPFVDAVVSGPGDLVFREIVDRVLAGKEVSGLPGVLAGPDRERAGETALFDAPAPASLDELPYPLFGDYFADLESSGLGSISTYLSLETSRGCAWAQRPSRHCTFCGLNSASPAHMRKSGARMVGEIEHFARERPGIPLVMTDSSLPASYFDDAIPELAARGLGATIQYETRADLTRAQLAALRAAGIAQIQPGIESLSTAVLRLMRKGTTALQNVQLLKWARELGLTVLWNLLAGLPSEPESAYAEMEELIPLLSHLPPPQSFRFVSIVRGSPLFDRAAELGLPCAAAPRAYAHVFPFEPEVVRNLASQFPREPEALEPVARYTRGARDAVATWQRIHSKTDLVVAGDAEAALVVDRRPIAPRRTVVLRGLERWLLDSCAGITSLARLQRGALEAGFGAAVQDGLESLRERRLVIREGSRWLSLPLRILERSPAGPSMETAA